MVRAIKVIFKYYKSMIEYYLIIDAKKAFAKFIVNFLIHNLSNTKVTFRIV